MRLLVEVGQTGKLPPNLIPSDDKKISEKGLLCVRTLALLTGPDLLRRQASQKVVGRI